MATATALLLLLLFVHSSLALNQEGLLLLQAKHGLDDPLHSLSDWDPRDPTPCNWTGVSCSSATVVAVSLPALGLSGPFPSSLCLLPNLSFVSLAYNFINSSLSSSSLLPCPSLSHLDLSQNLLVGPLPTSLSLLPFLSFLDLSGNNFSGDIPRSFAAFPRLQYLSLVGNLLSGTVPAFLSNISSLLELNISYNPFSPSTLPPSFADLANLRVLWLASCNLVGRIPSSLGRLAHLTDLDLSTNSLSGPIPASLAALSSVVQIELFSNSLSGSIPAGLDNLTNLRFFDASMNQLSGRIPDDIFLVPKLKNLNLYENKLTGPVPSTISRCRNLADIRLFSNQLSGPLPVDFGKNLPLVFIDISNNNFSGEIPAGICEQGKLEELLLLNNLFSGSIPDGLGRCRTLTRVRLSGNRLSGEVPNAFWGLPHVSLLELAGNSLSGGISPALSGAANLSQLLISNNQFSGTIPVGIGTLSNMYAFSAFNNRLSGPLPASLGSLALLGKLDLHNNSLSGNLPIGIQSWRKLSQLNLADNDFTGGIPPELGELPTLNYLDLSGNALTGGIPTQLQNLKLDQFNLSNNQLSGAIPPLFLSNAYKTSFLGNPGLCRDLTELCPSPQRGTQKNHGFLWLLRAIFLLSAVIFIAGVVWFYRKYRDYRKGKLRTDKSKWTLTSFHKLGFSEYEILDCLDVDNVIGSGASGKVYKVVLSNGETVAVKKLWGVAKKESDHMDPPAVNGFEAEVRTLGKIRHKNIVKLWCSCENKDCQLLVYEYMPNGSLGDLLHGSKGGLLDWPIRYKIALDSAEGLAYLHHDCVPPIVHRDVKSNNILLDGEFGAKVADFGVAKTIGRGSKSMSTIAGSCGYIAPEYAYTLRVNEKSDIYSFGVVILELVTGKLPVDPEFGDKDLVKWVCSTMEQEGLDHVVDPKLNLIFKEDIYKVLNIGLLCTSTLPINRPSMRLVVKMLREVRPEEKTKPKPVMKDEKLSPYYCEDTSDQGSIV